MSTKSSLFLTKDNEHCYTDCNKPNYKDGEYIGDAITIEFDKKNIEIVADDNECLVIEIEAGSELYELVKMMKN